MLVALNPTHAAALLVVQRYRVYTPLTGYKACRKSCLDASESSSTAAVLDGYVMKRMAAPSRRSTTAQNSAYERATTLFRR